MTPLPPVPAPQKLSASTRLGIFLLALVVIVGCLFLIFPSDRIVTPDWVPAIQSELRAALTVVSPYLGVALLSMIVAIAELASTFPTYPREALRTRWARVLILVNVGAAFLALIIARVTMPSVNPVLLVIGVGVGFQAIIRTRFVLARAMGGPEGSDDEVSLNLGWLYEQFQHLCRTQIDLELMKNRRTAVIHLLQTYPTIAELYDIAYYTIIARATLTPEEERARVEQLQTLIDPKAPEQFARNSMALTILENGGPAYVELLLSQAMGGGETAAAPSRASQEELVWQLINNYSLDGLVDLTHKLSDDPKVREWVSQAAAANQDTVEATQKASIAYFLLQQVGQRKVQQALDAQAKRPSAPANSPPDA
ncbi:MAG: hypothetical protein KC441_09700 [Anaerolineales bacterium]|nr:hypothetical protein [Anaerolineales bacterium]